MSDANTAITLCMIVRNEEHCLARCLESARCAVDETVVVDTGSRDRSAQVARGCGARVIHASWNDDFSAARNLSLQHARTPWVLVLDADEVLAEGAAPRIRAAVHDDEASGYFLRFVNPISAAETLRFLIVRLLRLAPGVRFQNVIHEQVTPSLETVWRPSGKRLKLLDVEVHHEGYREEVMVGRAKEERNLRLFEKQISRHPDDLYSWYKYGDFLRRTSHKERALGVLERAFALLVALPVDQAAGLPYASEIVTLLALELNERGAGEQALSLLESTRQIGGHSINREYVHAGLALRAGRLEEARGAYERCLAARDQPSFVARRDGISGYLARGGLAAVAALEGRIDEAERYYRQALAENPAHQATVLGLASLLALAGRFRDGLAVLESFLAGQPDDARVWLRGAGLWLRAGDLDQARTWYAHAKRCGASVEGLTRLAGALALAENRPAEAARRFARLPRDPECIAGLALALLLDGRREEADRWRARVADPRLIQTFLEILRACGGEERIARAAASAAWVERLFDPIPASRG